MHFSFSGKSEYRSVKRDLRKSYLYAQRIQKALTLNERWKERKQLFPRRAL